MILTIFLWLVSALSPWDMIGSPGARNFLLCKKPKTDVMADDRSSPAAAISRKGSGSWKSWINKSFSLKVSSHWGIYPSLWGDRPAPSCEWLLLRYFWSNRTCWSCHSWNSVDPCYGGWSEDFSQWIKRFSCFWIYFELRPHKCSAFLGFSCFLIFPYSSRGSQGTVSGWNQEEAFILQIPQDL